MYIGLLHSTCSVLSRFVPVLHCNGRSVIVSLAVAFSVIIVGVTALLCHCYSWLKVSSPVHTLNTAITHVVQCSIGTAEPDLNSSGNKHVRLCSFSTLSHE